MSRRNSIFAIAVLACVAAVGCAKAPQEDIDAAQADMDKAREAQAETWAPNEYQAADSTFKAANDEIQAQNAKWIKNYDKAKELLTKSKEEASKAAQASAANKEQAKTDSEAAIAAADTSVAAAEAGLKVAPVTKDSRADLALFKTDLENLRGTLEQARQAFGAGDYKKALEGANSVKDKATSIADQLEQAKQKRAGQARAR